MLNLFLFSMSAFGMTNESLSKELIEMMQLEQSTMRGETNLDKGKLFKLNSEKLKKIVKEYGWPTIDMVGKTASQAAWLIAQHSDKDRQFQLSVLYLMKPLAKEKKIAPSNFAYLYDRTHQPQLYGTQGECKSEVFVPFEMELPESVESRRKEIGMQSLKDYIAMATNHMCKKQT